MVLLLDADTRLSPDYLETGLPLFNDPEVVAVSGGVRTMRDPLPQTMAGFWPLPVAALRRGATAGEIRPGGKVGERDVDHSGVCEDVSNRHPVPDRHHRPGLVVEDFNMTFDIQERSWAASLFNRTVRWPTPGPR